MNPGVREVFASSTQRDPLVTVIVPLYNYAHLVTEALESVASQTLEAIELVVVNDASLDDSADVAEQWLRRNQERFVRNSLLLLERNSGLAAARNIGVRHASADTFFPLDPDNVLYPRCLQALHTALVRAPQAAFSYSMLESFEAGRGIMGNALWDPARLAQANYIDAMALVRIEAWEAVNGYSDMQVAGWEDYDFWCKLHAAGRFGIQVPNVLARYRVHFSSMLRTLTNRPDSQSALVADMRRRHPWMAAFNSSRTP